MKPTEAAIRRRFQHRLPSLVKNPRKLKRAWKRVVLARLRRLYGRNRACGFHYRLHWVRGSGWTVTVHLTRKA